MSKKNSDNQQSVLDTKTVKESMNVEDTVSTEDKQQRKPDIEKDIEERLKEKETSNGGDYRGVSKTILISIVKIALPIVAFILVVCVILSAVQKKNNVTEEDNVNSEIAGNNAILYTPLGENAIPELNAVVGAFYQALAEGNMDIILDTLGDIDDIDSLTYQKKSEMIEEYDNIVCYTKPGVDENSYFLYVYYEARLQGTETLAPGLNTWYASLGDDGKYKLCGEKKMPENVSAALKLVTNEDDVVDLFNRVDVKYNEAVASDETLPTILNDMITRVREEVGVELAQLASSSTEETAESISTETEEAETVVENTPVTPQNIEKVEQVRTTDTVKVRSSDSTEADTLGKVPKGTTLTRTEEKINGWSKVIYEDKEAYIKSDYLETLATGIEDETIGVVKALENVNVRSTADQDADNRIGGVQAGTSYNLLERLDGWYKIDFNGTPGYVKSEYFE